ncbi:Oidioi.mRNA.OKI2018_I69.PAR.g8837.t1.cds [Oikopleura dioica]|uniref:Oidioi.mRNA.OKI2018_I69.PAR.g8837.t1.cds n=1 Tax=Oikopleura dioica TaxID=34765 RepID=A0ABN7RLA6_OIKDI|nr:Oidioi.mRNA.OKI2018_I69.PAR.g8837.t1.cds [Oikopleura dioica]
MTVIRLIKDHQLGYGFSFSRNFNSSDNKAIIAKIKSNGPAEKAGLSIGDEITEVNRISVKQLSYPEIVELIKESPSFLLLKIAEKVPEYTNSNEAPLPRLIVLSQEALKSFHFGFYEQGLIISFIQENGPAEEAGLKLDDRIIEINNINVENMRPQFVLDLLHGDEEKIEILVVNKEYDSYWKNYRAEQGTITKF